MHSLSWSGTAALVITGTVVAAACSSSPRVGSANGAGGGMHDGGTPDAGHEAGHVVVVHTAASCSASDVNAAIAIAKPGEAVAVPAGSCTWSTNDPVNVLTSITLQGAGIGMTKIEIGQGAGYAPVIHLGAGAVLAGFSIDNPTNSYPVHADGDGFRITNNEFTGSGVYEIRIIQAYGLIDANTFANSTGEFIQTVGKCDSWQTDDSFGGPENVFIENNTLEGGGYITCNADARCVFRFNTITGSQFFEAHQKCTNTNTCNGMDTHRGPRESEVYDNFWNTTSGYFDFADIYGGTARVFNNVIVTPTTLWLSFAEYTAFATMGCWDYTGCNCTWPALDQVGVGKDPLMGASDPVYVWNNTMGKDLGSLMAVDVTLHDASPCQSACGSMFSMATIIKEGRDYFVSATQPSQPAAIADYQPYACPHPLTGLTGHCDPNKPGKAGYDVP